jgi:hypothetical protein
MFAALPSSGLACCSFLRASDTLFKPSQWPRCCLSGSLDGCFSVCNGVLELAIAFGFLVPKSMWFMGWLAARVLILFFPANIYAAINDIPMGGHGWGQRIFSCECRFRPSLCFGCIGLRSGTPTRRSAWTRRQRRAGKFVRVCRAWHRASEAQVSAPGARGAEYQKNRKGVHCEVGSGGGPIQTRRVSARQDGR